MRAIVSSRGTYFYKFIFPTFWIILFGIMPYEAIFGPHELASKNATSAGIIAATWIVGSALLLRVAAIVLRVQYRDGRLYASNFRREIEIRPGDIESVTQNKWINVRPITIHLRSDLGFGRRIRFIPPARVIYAFWKEDPIVDELREFATQLPERS